MYLDFAYSTGYDLPLSFLSDVVCQSQYYKSIRVLKVCRGCSDHSKAYMYGRFFNSLVFTCLSGSFTVVVGRVPFSNLESLSFDGTDLALEIVWVLPLLS